MAAEAEQEYDPALVALLETVWGEGFLSPGGAGEVARIVEGLDLRGASVLDFGCGTGGAAFLLAEQWAAREVVGVDVSAALIAQARAAARGLAGRVRFRRIDPGPLPLPDGAFDVVFSKDSLVHVPDKAAICREILRVLRPGGVFAASDWMRRAGPVSAQLQYYIDVENLGFGMGSPEDYRVALAGAGFPDARLTDRSAWYREQARAEHAALNGPLYAGLAGRLGEAFTRHEIEVWRALTAVLDAGELLPTHVRARKPE